MKSLFHIGIAIFVLCLAAPVFAQPRLKAVDGTKLDFGKIDRGTVVERKVSLQNVGDQLLVISGVDASCGCTGTVMSESQILPGKTGTLLITFNSKNFTGPVHKTVTVKSNSASEPRMVIEFTARVIEEISVAPSQLLFRDAEVGRVATQTLKIKNEGREKLTLTGFRTALPGLTAHLPPNPIAPNDSVQIVVEFKPKEIKTVLSDLLYLTTSSKKQPEVMVYVFGNTKEFKFQ